MMRYCIVCGACLETHNLSFKYCQRAECQGFKKRSLPRMTMRKLRREQNVKRWLENNLREARA